jgi:hypothetical protein
VAQLVRTIHLFFFQDDIISPHSLEESFHKIVRW